MRWNLPDCFVINFDFEKAGEKSKPKIYGKIQVWVSYRPKSPKSLNLGLGHPLQEQTDRSLSETKPEKQHLTPYVFASPVVRVRAAQGLIFNAIQHNTQ